jgi:hypothetical protein
VSIRSVRCGWEVTEDVKLMRCGVVLVPRDDPFDTYHVCAEGM